MFKRRKIGSINTQSPAQKVKGWLVSLTAKIIFTIIASIAMYYLFTYVIHGVLNFLSEQVLQANPIDENNPIFLGVMVVFIILVDIYILKDKLSKRK